MTISTKGTGVLNFDANGLGLLAISGGNGQTLFQYTSPTQSGLSAGAERPDIYFGFANERAWTGGTTVALQREFRLTQPSYGASTATTMTEAATLAIDGAPLGPSANLMTITTTEALRVVGGGVSGPTTTAYAINVTAPTGATNNFAMGINGDITFTGSAPTPSSCGGGAAAAGSTDHKGQITGISAATACTITFAGKLGAAPACTFATNVSGSAPYASAISTSAVTVTMASLTGTLYYHCF
jgi:hypothetical protein